MFIFLALYVGVGVAKRISILFAMFPALDLTTHASSITGVKAHPLDVSNRAVPIMDRAIPNH